MKTIAIKYTYEGEDFRPLVKALYDHTLKDDPLFHFFFERTGLVIRVSSEQCRNEIVAFLRRRNIVFEEYPYPRSFNSESQNGESKERAVETNLDLLLPVFHADAVAAVTLSQTDHHDYLENVTHAAFNPRFGFDKREGVELIVSGLRRLVMAQKLEAQQANKVLQNILEALRERTTYRCS